MGNSYADGIAATARPHSMRSNRWEVVLNGADDPGSSRAGRACSVEIVSQHPNPS